MKAANLEVYLWLEARIRNFIVGYKLGNVLYLYSNACGSKIYTHFNFWANAYLLRKIEKACIGGKIWDLSQREKMSEEYLLKHYSHLSYGEVMRIVKEQSLIFEIGDFYTSMDCASGGERPVWSIYPDAHVGQCFGRMTWARQFYHRGVQYCQLLHKVKEINPEQYVKSVKGYENYFPMLVYDLMENWQNGEPWPMAFYQKREHTWNYEGEHEYKLELDANLQKYPWHRRFPPKQKWEVYKGKDPFLD
ncbi:MAG: hypothetical protein IJX20_00645, partial [Alphaproteobacteria bacterium]|nr:hypothetical protein [Alphaproteobacteria bacterium]